MAIDLENFRVTEEPVGPPENIIAGTLGRMSVGRVLYAGADAYWVDPDDLLFRVNRYAQTYEPHELPPDEDELAQELFGPPIRIARTPLGFAIDDPSANFGSLEEAIARKVVPEKRTHDMDGALVDPAHIIAWAGNKQQSVLLAQLLKIQFGIVLGGDIIEFATQHEEE
jgi:hypothetical protein